MGKRDVSLLREHDNPPGCIMKEDHYLLRKRAIRCMPWLLGGVSYLYCRCRQNDDEGKKSRDKSGEKDDEKLLG